MKEIYKRDKTGNIRVWSVESDGDRYRYHTGVQGGTITVSGWTTVHEAKSQATIEAQVEFEVEAAYRHQLTRDYFETVAEVDTPRVIFPMLASKYKDFKPGWAQPKLDGMRCIAKANGLFSRQGKPILSVPHIEEALAPFFAKFPDATLDGELYTHEMREDFEALMSLCRKGTPQPEAVVVQYHVYDYPSGEGGFAQRWDQLSRDIAMVGDFPSSQIQPVSSHYVHTEGEFDRLFELWLDNGYEGGIWRDADGEYVFDGRPKFLQKRTLKLSAEFPVIDIELGNGNWAGIPKSATVRLVDGQTCDVGIAGTREENVKLLDNKPHFATVEFKGWTKDRKLRCGVVKDWHGPEGRTD
jgi:DNA ligase-1